MKQRLSTDFHLDRIFMIEKLNVIFIFSAQQNNVALGRVLCVWRSNSIWRQAKFKSISFRSANLQIWVDSEMFPSHRRHSSLFFFAQLLVCAVRISARGNKYEYNENEQWTVSRRRAEDKLQRNAHKKKTKHVSIGCIKLSSINWQKKRNAVYIRKRKCIFIECTECRMCNALVERWRHIAHNRI